MMRLNELNQEIRRKLEAYSDNHGSHLDLKLGINDFQTIYVADWENEQVFLSRMDYIRTKMPPLHLAIEKGDLDVVEELCKFGADLHKKANGKNAMQVAFEKPDDECKMIKLLLKYGATKTTAVDEALARYKEKKEESKNNITKKLTKTSVVKLTQFETFSYSDNFNEISKWREHGYAPLHYAAKIGDIDLINELCEAGADVNLKDKNEHTPLDYAAERGLVQVVKALLEHKPTNAAIADASKLADKYRKSMWSSCFWKGCQRMTGNVVDYNETLDELNSAEPTDSKMVVCRRKNKR